MQPLNPRNSAVEQEIPSRFSNQKDSQASVLNFEDLLPKPQFDHPIFGKKTGGINFASQDFIKQTLGLRNENFELKQELEKAVNFRQISEIEVKKLRAVIAELEAKNEELDSHLRLQKSEIITMKKQLEIFSGGQNLKKMLEEDFENFFNLE